MTKQEKNEYIMYIQSLYDDYLQKYFNRGISYGELNYIENLRIKELKDLCNFLIDILYKED